MRASETVCRRMNRFNVALTRAQALLVVVGNANVLMVDPYWAAFLRLCYRHRGMPSCCADAAAGRRARAQ